MISCYYSNIFNCKQSFQLHEFGPEHDKTSRKLRTIKTEVLLAISRLQNSRFFLKISKEIGKAWRKSLTRAKRASLTISIALCFQPRSRPFLLFARKYGLFCSLGNLLRKVRLERWNISTVKHLYDEKKEWFPRKRSKTEYVSHRTQDRRRFTLFTILNFKVAI